MTCSVSFTQPKRDGRCLFTVATSVKASQSGGSGKRMRKPTCAKTCSTFHRAYICEICLSPLPLPPQPPPPLGALPRCWSGIRCVVRQRITPVALITGVPFMLVHWVSAARPDMGLALWTTERITHMAAAQNSVQTMARLVNRNKELAPA